MTGRYGAGAWALAALVWTLAAFWPVSVQFLELWMDADRPYSHGLLVGPLSVWLVARACRDEWQAPSSRSWLALLLFVGLSLCWLGAFAINIVIGQHLLLPALLLLAVATLTGWPMARKLAFPIGFLYFAIPIWAAATPTLQGVTVAVVGGVLDLAAIPLYVEGNLITIPEGVFEVAGGCAGLHFFIVALTVASLYSYLNLAGFWRRMTLIAVSALIALVTNWVRVGSLVAVGHYTNMQHYLITHEHYYYGWVLFAIALVPMFLAARRLAHNEGAMVARSKRSVQTRPAWRLRDTAIVVMLGVWLVLPPSIVYRDRSESSGVRLALELPEGRGGWRREVPPGLHAWEPHFEGADGDVLASYVRGDDRVDVYLAVYRSQAQGSELVGDRNRLFAPDHRPLSASAVAVTGVPPIDIVGERVASSPDGAQRVVWYWYAVGTYLVVDDLQAKLLQMVGSFRGDDAGAVAAVSVACGQDCTAAHGQLESFLNAMGGALAATSLSSQAGAVR